MKTHKIHIKIIEIHEALAIDDLDDFELSSIDSDFLKDAAVGCHIFVDVNLPNSEEVFLMLIDTGASKSVIDNNFENDLVRKIKLQNQIESSGVNSAIHMEFGYIQQLSIHGHTFPNLSVGITDLSYVNQIYQKISHAPIIGIIGGDFLKTYKARIDYFKKTLTLKV